MREDNFLFPADTRPGGEKMEEKKPQKKAMEVANALCPSQCDPQGSYTGVPVEPGEVPVQDQDDL